MSVRLGLLLAIALLLVACRTEQGPAPGPDMPDATVAVPSDGEPAPVAGPDSPANALRQGILALGKDQGRALAAARQLDELLLGRGMAVQSTLLTTTPSALQALCSGALEVAWLSPGGYLAAQARCPDVRLLFTARLPEEAAASPEIAGLVDRPPAGAVVAAPGLDGERASRYAAAIQAVLDGEAGRTLVGDLNGWQGVMAADESLYEPLRVALEGQGVDLQAWKGVSVPYQVGLVTLLGSVDEDGFVQEAYRGMLQAANRYGVHAATIETVAEVDYATNLEIFAQQGYDLILSVGGVVSGTLGPGDSAVESLNQIAQRYTASQFFLLDLEPGAYAANVGGAAFREDEAGFLAGALAGLMTESQAVGIVLAVPEPSARRWRGGFEHGLGYVCSDCRLIDTTIDSLDDPGRGRTAALSQIGEGVDVVFALGGNTAAGVLRGAARDGVWVIGAGEDQYLSAFEGGSNQDADRLLSSVVKRSDVVVFDLVTSVAQGSYSGGLQVYGTQGDGIDLAPFHQADGAISQQVRSALQQVREQLANGQLNTGVEPLTGEILAGQVPEPGSFWR